jgi:hypothetical protein
MRCHGEFVKEHLTIAKSDEIQRLPPIYFQTYIESYVIA